MMKKKRIILLILLVGILAVAGVEAATSITGGNNVVSSVNYQTRAYSRSVYSAEEVNTYWPILGDKNTCDARQDMLLHVPPGGCQPAVVRSDLLAEQNVPVFCQVNAIKINPLINIDEIKNIRFKGQYPEGVVGSGFHPAQAALRTRSKLLGSPLINNVGYVVVVLKKQEDESKLPESVTVNLTAQIDYEAGNAFGIGKTEFILKEQTDDQWNEEKEKQSFWNGRYFVRLDEMDEQEVTVSIYDGDRKITTTKIEKGKESNDVFIPGLYCRAGLNIHFDEVVLAQDKARIQVSDDKGSETIDVYEGSKFLDGKCKVTDLQVTDVKDVGKIEVKCGRQTIKLELKNNGAISVSKSTLIERLRLETKECEYVTEVVDGKCYKIRSDVAKNVKRGDFTSGDFVFIDYNHLYFVNDDDFGNAQVLINGNLDDNTLTSEDYVAEKLFGTDTSKWWSLPNMVLKRKGSTGTYILKKATKFAGVLNNGEPTEYEIGYYAFLPDGDLVFVPDDGDGIDKATYRIDAGKDIANKDNFQRITEDSQAELLQEKNYDDRIEKYFGETINNYKQIAEDYSAEKNPEAVSSNVEDYTYGEKALAEAIDLAAVLGKQQTQMELINLYRETYPDSKLVKYEEDLAKYYLTNYTLAGEIVEIDNRFRAIKVLSFEKPKEVPNADLRWGGVVFNLKLDNTHEIPGIGNLTLSRVEVDGIRVSSVCEKASTARRIGETVTGISDSIKLEELKEICGRDLRVEKINIEKVAKLRLIPKSSGTETETNLTVKIGIEKRAIKLSTEKTEELIKDLNETIKEWDQISNSLGNVVTGLKGACFATSGVLTVKNFFEGLNGQALARQKAMSGPNGWTTRCEKMVATREKGYSSLDQCYLGEAKNINADVNAYANALNTVNGDIKNIEGKYEESGVLGLGKTVDRSRAAPEYAKYLVEKYGTEKVKLSDGTEKSVADLIGSGDAAYYKKAYEDGRYGYEQLREIELNVLTRRGTSAESVLANNSNSQLTQIGENIEQRLEFIDESNRAQSLREKGWATPKPIEVSSRQNFIADVINLEKSTNANAKTLVNEENNIKYSATVVVPNPPSKLDASGKPIGGNEGKYNFEAGTYALGLTKLSNGAYSIESVKEIDSQTGQLKDTKVTSSEFVNAYNLGNIISQGEISYNNKYKNPAIRFYETEPYKGLPAIVPFDTRQGWYAATKPTLGVLGGIGAYESSGRVASFWLCNVGTDGREQFREGYGDDICQLINLNTGQPLGSFPGLSEGEAKKKVSQAVEALQTAASQYAKGRKIKINGEVFDVGDPAANVPTVQCQDFMSPEDCNLLFNVCDPVICPASRCDFGGKYPVADVIQTGIVGSALLCLPNAKEGIAVPVCLTGIKAGIDGYVSILKSHKACLEESLETGRQVGTCDLIHSVYMCEFFWRQAAPLANVLLPKFVETLYGQGKKGGGEYASVASAWQNAQGSVNYFTQYYASNSLKAFQARNIEEAGGDFCKAFVSAKAPKTIKTLLEPDSPPQFHAWFDAIKFNDATLPATSQYKVFYHIFSGEDAGVHYNVYLKNPPDSSFYSVPNTIQVASGFIAKGQFATETVDFTAPEGYKELCVRINNEEKCGFKQVSTSFALNVLRDEIVNGQIKESNVKTEEECVSGSPNAAALLNPNLGAAAGEALDPAIYNRGINRICATENPGLSTDPTRFSEVGICGTEKVKCWLDSHSVDKAITDNNIGLKNETYEYLKNRQKELLEGRGDALTEDGGNGKIDELSRKANAIIAAMSESKSVDDEKIRIFMTEADTTQEKIFFYNYQKVEILMIKAKVNAAVVKVLQPQETVSKESSSSQTSSTKPVEETKQEEKPAEQAVESKECTIEFYEGNDKVEGEVQLDITEDYFVIFENCDFDGLKILFENNEGVKIEDKIFSYSENRRKLYSSTTQNLFVGEDRQINLALGRFEVYLYKGNIEIKKASLELKGASDDKNTWAVIVKK